MASALLIFACVVLAGCADGDRRSGNGRFGGFYGGVSGGATR
ncbi:MAG TPA: hypothetical protein VFC56_15220 [Stellaceae bacterium]|nr:hypothetical protein [Stellaceae bacterium]